MSMELISARRTWFVASFISQSHVRQMFIFQFPSTNVTVCLLWVHTNGWNQSLCLQFYCYRPEIISKFNEKCRITNSIAIISRVGVHQFVCLNYAVPRVSKMHDIFKFDNRRSSIDDRALRMHCVVHSFEYAFHESHNKFE